MALIDPTRNWAMLEDRIAAESDPACRRNLLTMLDHSKSELAGEFDATLAGMGEEAQHISYNNPDDPRQNPKGKAAIRAYYDNLLALDLLKIQVEVDRLLVTPTHAVRDGVLRMAYPAHVLALMGIEVADPTAYYLYEARMAQFWPFDERGLCMGEHNYTVGDGFAGIATRKLRDDDIVRAPPYVPVPGAPRA